ncbi:MAG: DUF898 domain-containing protein [Rhodospirillaceae bacterium]|nr:DUF898 domain-containing protein [Rhodospirillaceae bacterium]
MRPDDSMRLTPSSPRQPADGATLSSAYPDPPRSGYGGNGSGFSAFGTAPTADGRRTALIYNGRLGEVYRIFLVNLLLTLVTLGIYRFWGKTRLRRYLWSHTSLSGDHFEYTGTGLELFLGFIVVMVFIVLAQIGMYALAIAAPQESPLLPIVQSSLGLIILYITFVGRYAAQRYRLTRTLWRGISGNMTGSAWAWGLKGLLFSFLAMLTIGLAWPWAQMRLIDDRINRSYFGDAKASGQTSSKPLYVAYLIGIVSAVILSVMAFSIIIGSLTLLAFNMSGDGSIKISPSSTTETSPEMIWLIFVGVIAFLLTFWAISIVAFSFYQAAMIREIGAKLRLAGMHFSVPMTAGALMGRTFGNIFIILVTLGLGLPIAIQRTMKFIVAHVEVIGDIDGTEIKRSPLRRPGVGEGLLEAFDPGIL